ncbi:hypothetical protein CDD81_417 [Ophiocordyceps australis]|uniref:Sorting nexin/Vps5-like C-terminal domain-containing protein n=1 Tax=Ophiocordyceps australis TaxID=1399860 RepID=A0A2C5Y2D0_9HYPO|nr:hypothetical protein CDD81_417 [Ophiocordyceps australis]
MTKFSETISFKNYCALMLVLRKEHQDYLRKAGEYGQLMSDTERELLALGQRRSHVLFTRPKTGNYDSDKITLDMEIGLAEKRLRAAERDHKKYIDKAKDTQQAIKLTEDKINEHYRKEWRATRGLLKKY